VRARCRLAACMLHGSLARSALGNDSHMRTFMRAFVGFLRLVLHSTTRHITDTCTHTHTCTHATNATHASHTHMQHTRAHARTGRASRAAPRLRRCGRSWTSCGAGTPAPRPSCSASALRVHAPFAHACHARGHLASHHTTPRTSSSRPPPSPPSRRCHPAHTALAAHAGSRACWS
jgi:hypothetical protein